MKYQARNPSNARIYINYDLPKEGMVNFKYPDKKSEFKIWLRSLYNLFIKIFVIVLVFMSLFTIIGIIFGFSIRWGSCFLVFVVFAILIFFLSLIFSKNKLLNSYLPYINTFINLLPFGNYNYIKITKLKAKMFEIPIFGNTFLDYKATEQFSRFLKRVEVVEHKFVFIKTNVLLKIKREKNDWLWYARFYFSKIPKKGFLEVRYL